jgi:hypothetical protein
VLHPLLTAAAARCCCCPLLLLPAAAAAAAAARCCCCCCCRKKQELVDAVLQPPSSFPRPSFLAADLATTPLDTALLTHTNSSTNTNDSNTKSDSGNGSSGSSSSGKFDPSQPTLFTVEGLVYYLTPSAVQALFGAMLRVAAPGSRVAFDFLHQEVRLGGLLGVVG